MLKRISIAVTATLALGLAAAGCNNSSSRGGAPLPPSDAEVRTAIAGASVTTPSQPVENANLVALGRALFFDKVLSGNQNISCATCHHPTAATGDALPLSLGEGATGTASARVSTATGQVIPRNAPDLFNDGVTQARVMFWDGRVSFDPGTGAFTTPEPVLNGVTPARPDLTGPLDSALAAQAMFPVTSFDEMRGKPGSNPIADATSNVQIWQLLMARLVGTNNGTVGGIAGYRTLFQAAFPGVTNFDQFTFGHAARAIAAFERDAYVALNSPFDRYLAGTDSALSDSAKRGALLFFGAARCGQCHSGPLLSDDQFHALCVPQLGPGKGGEPDDRGRALITGNTAENYRFRTSVLRNVEFTGPWMHDGAFTDLRVAVQHHLNPQFSLNNYNVGQLPAVFQPLLDLDPARTQARISAVDPTLLPPVFLTNAQLDDLIEFLRALSDSASIAALANDQPPSVPSGLPVVD
ncbi:MAG: cytochrome-c peroxidase [Planctomycetes bacterium]|nr:cytochrome-c peroxidase [Planctomycetota bacterium]